MSSTLRAGGSVSGGEPTGAEKRAGSAGRGALMMVRYCGWRADPKFLPRFAEERVAGCTAQNLDGPVPA